MKEWIEKEDLIDLLYWIKDQNKISEDGLNLICENLDRLKTIKTEE